MARGFKGKVRVIEVKPADGQQTVNILSQNKNCATPDRKANRSYDIKQGNEERNNFNFDQKETTSLNVNCANFIQLGLTNMKKAEELRANEVSIVDSEEARCGEHCGLGDQFDVDEVEKKKQKKRKKKKKKKEKKEISVEQDAVELSQNPGTESLEDVNTEIEVAADEKKSPNKERKLPCLFGFIASWLVKRREKRRAKKRRAIEERKSASLIEELVEYEHRRARGGESFKLQIDNRPANLAVLPPIKRRPEKASCGTEEKLKRAEIKREQELEKKKKSSKVHDIKRNECKERKEESELYFKQKADLNVKCKQEIAEQNRARFQEDRRGMTALLRAPSTLPPLRVIRVKEYNPDDEIFKF